MPTSVADAVCRVSPHVAQKASNERMEIHFPTVNARGTYSSLSRCFPGGSGIARNVWLPGITRYVPAPSAAVAPPARAVVLGEEEDRRGRHLGLDHHRIRRQIGDRDGRDIGRLSGRQSGVFFEQHDRAWIEVRRRHRGKAFLLVFDDVPVRHEQGARQRIETQPGQTGRWVGERGILQSQHSEQWRIGFRWTASAEQRRGIVFALREGDELGVAREHHRITTPYIERPPRQVPRMAGGS